MSRKVCQIDILQTKLCAHATIPLVVVVDGPGKSAGDVDAVEGTSSEDVVKVALDVVCATQVPQDLGQLCERRFRGIGEANLGNHDALVVNVAKILLGQNGEESAESGRSVPKPLGAGIGVRADWKAVGSAEILVSTESSVKELFCVTYYVLVGAHSG